MFSHDTRTFQLEDVEVTVADHVQKVMKPNFAASWDEIGPEMELEDTYALSTMKTMDGKCRVVEQAKVLSLHKVGG